jgi:CDP-Glycerol:Poly(glycerophosphate) glycerophosphotransferase
MPHGRAWSVVEAMRAMDVALTRRAGRRSVLIDSRTAMNYVMAAPIQAALAADPRVVFYATASESPGATRTIYQGALPRTTPITPARAALMRFDAYLTADLLWARLPRGTRRIQMFHGVAGKFRHDYDAPETSMRRWHRLFFVNRRRLQNFITAGAVDPGSDAPRLVGMPKVDCLVDGSLRRDAVLRKLRLDPSRPTILYAPTWSAHSSLNLMGVELVERLLAHPWNLIVKLHDRSRDRREFYSGGVDWVARLNAVMSRETAHLAANADVCPYLAAADVMITDHSSAGFEYLLLDRPLVRIHIPELIRASNISEEYVSLMIDASTSTDSAAATVDAVERSLADPSSGSLSRRAVAQELFHEPGTATARAVAELYEVLELAPLRQPSPSVGQAEMVG